MRQRLLLAFIACFFVFTLTSAFAENQPTQSTTGVSQEDAKKVKEAAQFLGNAFGVKTKEEPKKEEAPATNKTMADVADKGLDMVKGFVATLSETLKNIAPKVWEVMIRQQYAKAVGGLVVPWGLIGLILVYVGLMKRWWNRNDITDSDEKEGNMWITRIIPTVIAFILAIWGFNRLSDSILLLINPEYYAIKDLLEMILR